MQSMSEIRRRTGPFRDAASLGSFWSDAHGIGRLGYLVGAALIASGVIHGLILIVGGGCWEGPLSLRKPTTFGLSFGLTLLTIVWVSSFLRLGERTRKILLGGFIAACTLETALVTLQAWRGVPSHFNLETPFDALIARVLAGGGMALVAIILALTVASFRSNPAVPPSLRLAIRVGFVSLMASLVVGALMIAKGMMLVFAGQPEAAYATGGTLKPTHAVTMHAILVLPLLAWLLSFTDWSERRRVGAVATAAAGYATLAAAVAIANVTGVQPGQSSSPLIAISATGALLVLATGVLAAVSARHG